MAELYRARISAVLAADTKLDVRSGCLTFLYSHLYKLANTSLVKLSERIRLVNLVLVVRIKELTGIITGEAKGHLCQVVGTEGEELSLLSDLHLQSEQHEGSRSWYRYDTGCRSSFSAFTSLSGLYNDILNELQLFLLAN